MGLPVGLSLSQEGEISGTPWETGSYPVEIIVTGNDELPSSVALDLRVVSIIDVEPGVIATTLGGNRNWTSGTASVTVVASLSPHALVPDASVTGPWQRADGSWSVSDDSALSSVIIEMLADNGSVLDAVSTPVTGVSASGTFDLRSRSNYATVRITVADAAGNQTTRSVAP